jgi:protein-S-isoprenylcysteine O-methyltransferase Ste14
MEPPMTDPSMTERPSTPAPAAKAQLVLGKWTLSGPAAQVVALLLLALVVLLVVWSRPSLGMLLAGGVWIGFLVFWSLSAGKGRAGRREESKRSRSLHQSLLNLGLLLLFVSIPGLRWRYLAPTNPWHVPVGLGVVALATLLHIYARLHLGKNWSTKVQIHSDHQLVRTGPYRWIRHPIYTAIVALALGTALVSGRVLSLVGVAVFTFAYVRKLWIEERLLGDEFGTQWHEYRRRSWALVPGLF